MVALIASSCPSPRRPHATPPDGPFRISHIGRLDRAEVLDALKARMKCPAWDLARAALKAGRRDRKGAARA